MSSELKPCPFCGGEAKFVHIFENPEKCMVSCRECDGGIDAIFANEEAAVAALNRRAQPANEPLTLEQMQGLLERLEAECMEAGNGREDYTNGYRWGHRNGQIELLRKVLRIGDGVCETDKPERSGSNDKV